MVGNIISFHKWVNQDMKVLDVALIWMTFQKELLMAHLMEDMRSCPTEYI